MSPFSRQAGKGRADHKLWLFMMMTTKVVKQMTEAAGERRIRGCVWTFPFMALGEQQVAWHSPHPVRAAHMTDIYCFGTLAESPIPPVLAVTRISLAPVGHMCKFLLFRPCTRHTNTSQSINRHSPILPSPATMLSWSWNKEITKLPHTNAFHNLIHLFLSIFDMI